MYTCMGHTLLVLNIFIFTLSAAQAPLEDKKNQSTKLTQTTLERFFKRKHSSPTRSLSHYQADADDEGSSSSEDDTPTPRPQIHVLPSATILPFYQCIFSEKAEDLAILTLAACKKTEQNHDRFRGAIYDLLNDSEWKANPDDVLIIIPHSFNKSYVIPLLVYGLLFCKNTDIVRLLAEKSSHEKKAEALECTGALKRVEGDPSIKDPYFSYFFRKK